MRTAHPQRRRPSVTARRLWITAGLVACGCSSSLRAAPRGPHPLDTRPPGIRVDAPPPPAKVEAIPRDPGQPCVWVDGEWRRSGRTWEWERGAWRIPAPDCYYAEPVSVWQDGVLYYSGTWYHSATHAVCPPPRPCPGAIGPAAR